MQKKGTWTKMLFGSFLNEIVLDQRIEQEIL